MNYRVMIGVPVAMLALGAVAWRTLAAPDTPRRLARGPSLVAEPASRRPGLISRDPRATADARPAAARPQPSQPSTLPTLGEVRYFTSPTGDRLSSVAVAPGYREPPLKSYGFGPPADGDGVDDHAEEGGGEIPPAISPPEHQRFDARQFGFDTVEEMEEEVRRWLKLPEEHHVALRTEVRDGRVGVAIDVFSRQELERMGRRADAE